MVGGEGGDSDDPWTFCAGGRWRVCRRRLRDCGISHPSLRTADPEATDPARHRGRVSPSQFPKFSAAAWLPRLRTVAIRLALILEYFSVLIPAAFDEGVGCSMGSDHALLITP